MMSDSVCVCELFALPAKAESTGGRGAVEPSVETAASSEGALAAVSVAALVVRTALEDRFLRAGLDGYEAYAARVRFRLVPGVW